MVLFLVFTLSILLPANLKAQSVSINQQQQNININVPVIEKPVYIERYRTVYVEKPRVARKLDKPVLLLGYLWVYPEDLGNFKHGIPVSVINNVNAQKPFGRDNWRIPTPDELAVLEANAETIGLGDDIYLATDHCNGVLRMVSTGDTKEVIANNAIANGDVVSINGSLFRSRPIVTGMVKASESSRYINNMPTGWRLPNESEIYGLMNSSDTKTIFNQFKDCYVTYTEHQPWSGITMTPRDSYTIVSIVYSTVLNELSVFSIIRYDNDDEYRCFTSKFVYNTSAFLLPVLDQ